MSSQAIDVTQIELGRVGLDFVRQTLLGERGLAGHLGGIDLETGLAYAIVPPGVVGTQISDPSSGWPDKHVPAGWLTSHLEMQSKRAHWGCLLQDLWALPGDADAMKLTGRREMQFEDALVYCFEKGTLLRSAINSTLEKIVSYNYVLVELSIELSNVSAEQIGSFLPTLLDNVREILLPAFDQDGFILWRHREWSTKLPGSTGR